MSRCLVPSFIIENLKNNVYKGEFMGCSLFADITGFTQLTESLMKYQKKGSEALSEILNRIFGSLIESIYVHGGFVSNFMGDAFIAIFPDKSRYDSIERCYFALLKIISFIQKEGSVITSFGQYDLSIKCGFSYENIEWGIIGNDLYTYYFKGKAVDNCIKCQSQASQNEVACDGITVNLNKTLNYIPRKDYFIMPCDILPEKRIKSDINIPSYEEQNLFIPKNILYLNDDAEFRSSTNLFVNFQPNGPDELKEFTELLLSLSIKYQGYFNKLEYSDKGWVAIIIFGAPVSCENNPLQAVDLALELKTLERNIKWRAGITTGTVYAGFIGQDIRCEYTVIGNTVNLASRLMKEAEDHCIYCDNYTRFPLENQYSFRAVRDVKLKGFLESIQIYSLLNKKFERAEYLSKFVGREKELKIVRNFLYPLQEKENTMIIKIIGDAGIGKTRLFREAFSSFNDDYYLFSFNNREVLTMPFYSIIFFLKKYFNILENQSKTANYQSFLKIFNSMAENLKIPREKLFFLKNTLAFALGLSENKTLSPRMIYNNQVSAFKELIYYHSLHSPIVLLVENFQWIDDDSLCMINRIIEENFSRTAIALLTRRNDDKISRVAHSKEKHEVMHLSPLAVQESENIFREITKKIRLNKSDYDNLWEKIIRIADNNPYYIEQCSVYINENIDKIIDGESFVLPASINSIILSRFDKLSDDLKEILKTASVIGKEFTILLLNEILKYSNKDKCPSDLGNLLEESISESIISRIDEIFYIFSHALTADAVYEMQLLSKLRKLHLFTAKSMEKILKKRIKSCYYDLYYHYSKGEDTINALKYLKLSAQYAKDRYYNNDAIKFYRMLYEHYSADKNDKGRAEALTALYNIYQTVGEYKKAHEAIEILAEIPSRNNHNYYSSQIYKGVLLHLESKYEDAYIILSKIMAEREKITNHSIIADLYNSLANNYYYTGKYSKACKYFLKAEGLLIKINDRSVLAMVYGNLAGVYWYKGEFDLSHKYFMKEMALKKELKDKNGIAVCYGNMGNLFLKQGKYEKALKYFKIFYRNCLKTGWMEGLSVATGNIGIIYDLMGNFKLAIKNYLKQLEIAKKLNNISEIARCYGNLGISYTNLYKYNEALDYIQMQKKLKEDIKDPRGLAYAHQNLFRVYHLIGNYDKAKLCIDKLYDIASKLEDSSIIAETNFHCIEYYYHLEQYSKSLEMINEAETICEERKLYRLLIRILILKIDVLMNFGRYNDAEKTLIRTGELIEGSELNTDNIRLKWYGLLLEFYLKENVSTIKMDNFIREKIQDHIKIVFLLDLIRLKSENNISFKEDRKESLKILQKLMKKDIRIQYRKYKEYLTRL